MVVFFLFSNGACLGILIALLLFSLGGYLQLVLFVRKWVIWLVILTFLLNFLSAWRMLRELSADNTVSRKLKRMLKIVSFLKAVVTSALFSVCIFGTIYDSDISNDIFNMTVGMIAVVFSYFPLVPDLLISSAGSDDLVGIMDSDAYKGLIFKKSVTILIDILIFIWAVS